MRFQMKEICIHGAFRSGTNFMRAILESNYWCTTYFDAFGWKHDFYPIVSKSSNIKYPKMSSVFISKNPYSLLYSIFQYCSQTDHNITSHTSDGISGFIRSPIIIHDGKRSDTPQLFFSNPIEYYSSYHWNLLSAMHGKEEGFHFRYEDLLTEPEVAISKFVSKISLQRKNVSFIVPDRRMKKLGSEQRDPSNFTESAKFELEKVQDDFIMSKFSNLDIKFIRDSIPISLMENLNYKF